MNVIFTQTVGQMLTLMLFIAAGYFLAKRELLPKDAETTLAKLETYLIMPAMIIDTFSTHCTPAALVADGKLLLVAVVSCVAAVALSFPLARAFAKPPALRRVYRYAFSFANASYVGNVVILRVFGSEMLFHYLMFGIPYFFVTYTWGFLTLTGEYGKTFSWKLLLQPIILALPIGMLLGLFQLPLPAFLSNAVASVTACLGPIAMLLTGMVVSRFPLRALLADGRVYLSTLVRLVALPTLFFFVARACGVTGTALVCVLAMTCMPFGLNTVVFPAAYGGDARPGASMAIVSHALSVITIPVLFALFLG